MKGIYEMKNNLGNIENLNVKNLTLKLDNYEFQNRVENNNNLFEEYTDKSDKKITTEYYYNFNTNILQKFEKIEFRESSDIIMTDLITTVID